MEVRKIQLTGGSSYTITLPKGWVERAQLGVGDVVGCAPLPDGRLVVHPHARGEKVPRRFELELTGNERSEHVFRELIAAYLMGYDVIKVKGKTALTPQAKGATQSAGRRVIGLEIVDEDRASVTIQDFLDPRDFPMEKGLRRMYNLACVMHEDAATCIETPDPALHDNVNERDDEVDRLFWMVNKQYHALLMDASFGEKMGLTAPQGLNVLLVARLIERASDHAVRISENAIEIGEDLPKDLAKRTAELHRDAIELLREAMGAFFKKDGKAANAVIDKANRFPDKVHGLLQDALGQKGERLVNLAYVIESISRTAAYAADVAETAINQRHAEAE